MRLLIALAVVGIAVAQEVGKPGTIEGVVRTGNGTPVAEVSVNTGPIRTATDSEGRYVLAGVPPGRRQVTVGSRSRHQPVFASRAVFLSPGQSVTVDFSVPLKAVISGKVFDSNNEPVPGVEVALIGREYGAGAIRHVRRDVVWTNDKGEYRMQHVQPGTSHLLLFRKTEYRRMPAVSGAPDDPALRRRAVIPTYYPGVAEPEAGTLIVLRAGEHREALNVHLLHSASYCIEGLLTAGGSPASMNFQIQPAHLSFAIGPTGGVTGVPSGGESGPDGRIRVCDLPPGDYVLTAFTGDINAPESLGTMPVSIGNRDVGNVTLQPVPHLALPVDLAWADGPPERPIDLKLRVFMISATRSFGGGLTSEAAAPPSAVEAAGRPGGLPGVLIDDYYTRVAGLAGRAYVKAILYGNEDVTHAAVRIGSAMAGAALRVLVGHDGGLLKIQTADRSGDPVPDATVIVMPAAAASDGELAGRLVTGLTDQHGDYLSPALMPGKYLVLATPTAVREHTPELIASLKAARNKAREITVDPDSTVALKLSPIELP